MATTPGVVTPLIVVGVTLIGVGGVIATPHWGCGGEGSGIMVVGAEIRGGALLIAFLDLLGGDC